MLALALAACTPWNGQASALQPKSDPPQFSSDTLYNLGVNALEAGNYKEAGKRFDQVEQTYPYSSWAVHAELMSGYARFLGTDFTGAIGSLNGFIELYPASPDIAYAYYLRALSYYQQVGAADRDQTATSDALAQLQEVINRFPDSAYARDAQLKIALVLDRLAGHDMAIGRYYERQRDYIAAINRYQDVIQNYQTTNHVAEALTRLTECYLNLGMLPEAKRTAAVLGYNYPGSKWYQFAYNDVAAAGGVPGASAPGRPLPQHVRVAAAGGDPKPTTKPPPRGFFGRVLNWVF